MEAQPPLFFQGAARHGRDAVRWCTWAPLSETVRLITGEGPARTETPMEPSGFGCFTCKLTEVAEGTRYVYRMSDGNEYPDPASRWQPEGVHRPSAVFFPEDYSWSDQAWRGIAREDLVIYELHVGTFTAEGTLDAIVARLGDLARLGVTALEIMPVAQFPGERNWGYDGVYPYAVQASYGGPRALQRLVDAAHAQGLAVILDVVYNHLGPEGNYLAKFGPYFTERYRTPWGNAVNFDGPWSDPVRQFVIDNACAWVRDFHVDGLRLDAVQTIYDLSARHILADVQAAVQEEARRANRIVHVIAETNQNDIRLVTPPERGGYGLDGVWSDDFHHAVHAVLTGERDGDYEDFGEVEQIARAYDSVFVYDGGYSRFRRRRHGSKVGDADRARFVVCIQNHDQVGNRATGDRFGTLLPPAAQRLACGLLLISPCTPLLFMGEEYGETRPFPFFCSFTDAGLIEAVRRGRREEFAALGFRWGGQLPDPQSPETFAAAKLSWTWSEDDRHGQLRRLYGDLLAARRRYAPLRGRRHAAARVGRDSGPPSSSEGVLVVERGAAAELIVLANLTSAEMPLPEMDIGTRRPLLSTEERRYGGQRAELTPIGRLQPYELVFFGRDDRLMGFDMQDR